MKIIVAEKMSSAAVKLLQEPGWTVVTPDQLNGNLAKELETADALLVRSAVQVNSALLAGAAKLRVIGRAGVGVDNIELEPATRKGIAVMNTPGGNAVAVAEHTIGLMLSMARFLPKANQTMHEGKWEKKSLQGTELRGKTLGIVGLGKIGIETGKRARAFGMDIVAHDPFVSAQIAKDNGIKLGSLDEVFAASDYLSLHVGLTPQTHNMINAESVKKMKKGVRIVNCARGELIEEAALVAALQDGQVAAAALDVFVKEPLKDSPLQKLDNVILTPHIAGSTNEAQEAVGQQIALQVKEYLKHGVIQNSVNVPSVSYDEYLLLKPYVTLAERLGSFLAQVSESSLESISLGYTGHITEWKTELIRNAAIKGILNVAVQDKANLVNAASLAAERGLAVHEERKPKASTGGAGSVLTITIKTQKATHVVKGAVLREETPRLLHVDGIDIEAPLQENLIYMRNQDVPGVIGKVGTVLGKHGINIANFSLGRRGEEPAAGASREAIAVVQVDGAVPELVISELKGIPAVQQAKAVRLSE
jgi:D-3-phosphoglycerate dehydrogenase / 2-oxoglutarate reductase